MASSASGAPGWTLAETHSIARLLEATDADAAHWAAGDWLLEHEPIFGGPHRRTGSRKRLEGLAEELGRAPGFLLALRSTAHAWPAVTRPACASWHLCRVFTLGGSERAQWRREQLEALPRGTRGRVTMPTLLTWRAEHDRLVAHSPGPERPSVTAVEAVPRPAPTIQLAPRAPAVSEFARPSRRRTKTPAVPEHLGPAVADLCDRCMALVDDADRLRRADGVPVELSEQLDGVAGAVQLLRDALVNS